MTQRIIRVDAPEGGPDAGRPALAPQAEATLAAFLAEADILRRGGIMTDLDGTAVLEREGLVVIPEIVSGGLTELSRLGCRVSINTLRFPLNVIRTFGREWYSITNAPLPLVSLNGGQIGYLEESGDAIAFREIAAFPIAAGDIDQVLDGVEALLSGGIDDIVVFSYPRDWTRGERIWTPSEERAEAARARYRSASEVAASRLDELRRQLQADEICMMLVLVDAAEDRLMAYQHARRSSFVTQAGVDKKFGAHALARLLDQDLAHSIGAGDTPMDSFLSATGLAVQVGSREIGHEGLRATVKLPDSLGLGAFCAAAASMLGARR